MSAFMRKNVNRKRCSEKYDVEARNLICEGVDFQFLRIAVTFVVSNQTKQ